MTKDGHLSAGARLPQACSPAVGADCDDRAAAQRRGVDALLAEARRGMTEGLPVIREPADVRR